MLLCTALTCTSFSTSTRMAEQEGGIKDRFRVRKFYDLGTTLVEQLMGAIMCHFVLLCMPCRDRQSVFEMYCVSVCLCRFENVCADRLIPR